LSGVYRWKILRACFADEHSQHDLQLRGSKRLRQKTTAPAEKLSDESFGFCSAVIIITEFSSSVFPCA
jgi:hypothetical protein